MSEIHKEQENQLKETEQKNLGQLTREEMLEIVKNQITEHRYQHTLGVVETAIQLAHKYGADPEKAEIAAIFHDYAKFRDAHEMAEIIKQVEEIPKDLLEYDKELWHAPVGAFLVQHEVGIMDEEVFLAIRHHTTGRPHMSILEKVVCLADYIEPGRHFPGVENVRELAKDDLDQALAQSLLNTLLFLEKKGQKVYPLMKDAYEDLTNSEFKGGSLVEIKQILKTVINAAEDKKAQNPVVLDIKGLSVIADYFVLCHGNSETQVQAIAKEIREKAWEIGLQPKPMEGYDDARWILIDLGDVVAHVFHREEREYYNLEKLWADGLRIEVGED